jgi:hypothetical protein
MTSDDRITKEYIVCGVVVVICRVCRLESVVIICNYRLPTNTIINQNPLSITCDIWCQNWGSMVLVGLDLNQSDI